jgi:8-oxo-dGTP pyrophosphatase MutT (NUDIX family)
LLVFAHRDLAEAGIQVPAGTVEPGEPPEAAACREVREESGLSSQQVRLVRKLAEAPEPEWDQTRHVYLFEVCGPLPDRWSHRVTGRGEDAGFVFDYYWLPATPALDLAGGQHRFLHLAIA